MSLEEAKSLLLNNVLTPNGVMILYGINLLPNSNAMGLIFYDDNGLQKIFFSEDCKII